MHLTSFLVGGMTSGAAFLMVHEQLSFRNRLSKKWIVREMAEAKFQEVKARARAARDDMEPTKMQSNLPAMSSSFQDEWNKAVKKLQDLAAGK